MCLGNHKPFELPHFDYSFPDENIKNSCDYVESTDLNSLSPHVSNLRIIHLNIRGLISKQSELLSLLTNGFGTAKSIDIAMLNETWLRKETKNKITFPGYSFISRERVGKKGGGIGILISNQYKFRQRNDLMIDTNTFEHVIVEIKTKKLSIIIISAYQPPNTLANAFLSDYKKLIDSLNKTLGASQTLTIGIGHNMDFLKSNVHKTTIEFIEYNLDSRLIPVISRPTRITRNSATLIISLYRKI